VGIPTSEPNRKLEAAWQAMPELVNLERYENVPGPASGVWRHRCDRDRRLKVGRLRCNKIETRWRCDPRCKHDEASTPNRSSASRAVGAAQTEDTPDRGPKYVSKNGYFYKIQF
jgi:hypothetical protein